MQTPIGEPVEGPDLHWGACCRCRPPLGSMLKAGDATELSIDGTELSIDLIRSVLTLHQLKPQASYLEYLFRIYLCRVKSGRVMCRPPGCYGMSVEWFPEMQYVLHTQRSVLAFLLVICRLSWDRD